MKIKKSVTSSTNSSWSQFAFICHHRGRYLTQLTPSCSVVGWLDRSTRFLVDHHHHHRHPRCAWVSFCPASAVNSSAPSPNTLEPLQLGMCIVYILNTFLPNFDLFFFFSKHRFVPPVTLRKKINFLKERLIEEEAIRCLSRPYVSAVRLFVFTTLMCSNRGHIV